MAFFLFLCHFLSLLCFFLLFFSFEKNSFSFAKREATKTSNHHHLLHLTSLFPSSTCISYAKGTNHKRGSLEVVHKHGPCSKLKQKPKLSHTEILAQDQARAQSITSKFSKSPTQEGMGQAQVPAHSGIPIGSGDYFVKIGLGSPANELSLIIDTASELSWTQCEPCTVYCYNQTEPIFDPSKSTSFSYVSCNSSLCTQLSYVIGNDRTCIENTCVYGIKYDDSSFCLGYLAHETLTLTPSDVVADFLFGCGQKNTGPYGGAAGILALGPNQLSFLQQTSQKYNQIFSYCLPSTPSSVGYLTFGAVSGEIHYSPISSFSEINFSYGLNLTGIALAGVVLPNSSAVRTIIDSATVISRLPVAAYGALRDAFRSAMSSNNYTMVEYPSTVLDTCYDVSGQETVVVPNITLSFEGGVNVELDAKRILYAVSETQVCLGFAGNSDDSDVGIIGNLQQKTLHVVYDVGGGRIGFGPNGCD